MNQQNEEVSEIEKQTCIAETQKHIKSVNNNLNIIIKELIERGEKHDLSKFEEPEFSIFARNTHKLAKVEFGSEEYKKMLEEVRPAIEHHFSKNRHHPEHWPNGIKDMNLVDLIEMLVDWKSATARNKNGNIMKSIDFNAAKFNMSEDLKQIFKNTVRDYLE